MRWKVGDFGFFEYKLAEVKEIDPERGVYDVSDGYFSVGGRNLEERMIPLNLTAKLVSAEVERVRRDIAAKEKGASLNWPDLHRKLVDIWLDTYELAMEKPKESPYKALYDFRDKVLASMEQVYDAQVEGFSLFGRS